MERMDSRAPSSRSLPAGPVRVAPAELACEPLFENLPGTLLGALAASARRAQWPAGSTPIAPGDPESGLWLVCRGRLRLSLPLPDGGERPLLRLGAGDTLGEGAVQTGRRHVLACQVTEDAEVIAIDGDALRSAVARSGLLAQRLLQRQAMRMDALLAEVASAAPASAEARLATMLLNLQGGRPDRSVLELPERKRDIALRLALAPETLSRALRAFQDAGLIRVDGYRVQVLDAVGLARTAGRQRVSATACPPRPAALPG